MELHIVLVAPEIPQNTGSIGRTCAAVGARLHLVEPLGFSLGDKYLKRAGLDYWNRLDVEVHRNWEAFQAAYPDSSLWFYTTKARQRHDGVRFGHREFLIFGRETAGLPEELLRARPDRCLRIPLAKEARSLNLSVAVGIAAYEALRQQRFVGLWETDPEGRLSMN